MGMTKGEGYSPSGTAVDTGRTATSRGTSPFGIGRGTPEKKDIPFARHVSVKIIIGEGTTSVEAKDDAVAAFDLWREQASAKHYRIAEIRFEFITETKMVIYIVYSE